MKLLLDIGNTRLKWALHDGALQPAAAVEHQGRPLEFFAALPLPLVSEVHIACVPRLLDAPAWRAAVQARCGVQAQIAVSAAEWRGLRSAYAEPHRLGVDRWLNLVAGWSAVQGAFCVVSAGTALTFDRVDAQGRHLGGFIAPGLGSMLSSLSQVTASATVQGLEDSQALGRDSASAIRQGAAFSAHGAILLALQAPGADAQEQRLITGGDAPMLLPRLGAGWQHCPHLVLQGLLALAAPSP